MPGIIMKKARGPYSKSASIPWREVFKEDLEKQGEIGVYLRGLRYRERLTQKALAQKLGRGVSQHHISEMENGKRTISVEMAKRLATVLHTDYRMFL
jgi:DNA-binding XRE family transcriptional regulator